MLMYFMYTPLFRPFRLALHPFIKIMNRFLSQRARTRIAAADQVFVSAATIWEAAIKCALGKLRAEPEVLAAEIVNSGFIELPVLARHAAAIYALPMHHKDPFDRLLIAQALSEPMRLLTADTFLQRYSELVEIV